MNIAKRIEVVVTWDEIVQALSKAYRAVTESTDLEGVKIVSIRDVDGDEVLEGQVTITLAPIDPQKPLVRRSQERSSPYIGTYGDDK